MKGNINAFARAHTMMAAIAAAMALGGEAQRAAMSNIGPYVSRGKGRGKGAKWLGGSSRNKYTPHIGAKEQARAQRCYMESFHGTPGGFNSNPRSAPVLCQMSKRYFLSARIEADWGSVTA